MQRFILAFVVITFAAVGTLSVASQEKQTALDRQAVRKGVDRAIQFLKSKYVAGKGWDQPDFSLVEYTGGPTGLVCLALLEAGENREEGELKQGLEYLRTLGRRRTYCVGCGWQHSRRQPVEAIRIADSRTALSWNKT